MKEKANSLVVEIGEYIHNNGPFINADLDKKREIDYKLYQFKERLYKANNRRYDEDIYKVICEGLLAYRAELREYIYSLIKKPEEDVISSKELYNKAMDLFKETAEEFSDLSDVIGKLKNAELEMEFNRITLDFAEIELNESSSEELENVYEKIETIKSRIRSLMNKANEYKEEDKKEEVIEPEVAYEKALDIMEDKTEDIITSEIVDYFRERQDSINNKFIAVEKSEPYPEFERKDGPEFNQVNAYFDAFEINEITTWKFNGDRRCGEGALVSFLKDGIKSGITRTGNARDLATDEFRRNYIALMIEHSIKSFIIGKESDSEYQRYAFEIISNLVSAEGITPEEIVNKLLNKNAIVLGFMSSIDSGYFNPLSDNNAKLYEEINSGKIEISKLMEINDSVQRYIVEESEMFLNAESKRSI